MLTDRQESVAPCPSPLTMDHAGDLELQHWLTHSSLTPSAEDEAPGDNSVWVLELHQQNYKKSDFTGVYWNDLSQLARIIE
jgi:hypothetical protein